MGDSSITVGDVEISHLYDLVADFPFPRTLDQAFPTVPAEAWEPYRREYPSLFGPGNVPRFHVGCYLIRSRGRTILVDTGVGPSSLGMAKLFGTGGHLPDRLRSAGVSLQDIDTVMFTHLHPDHVGWNLQQEGGQYRPTFPRARYVAHRADWDTVQRVEVQQELAAIAPGYIEQTLLKNTAGLAAISTSFTPTCSTRAPGWVRPAPGRSTRRCPRGVAGVPTRNLCC